ncbi:hypothetical protein RB595_004115 [Gaeumannomyces hyphopodioides]
MVARETNTLSKRCLMTRLGLLSLLLILPSASGSILVGRDGDVTGLQPIPRRHGGDSGETRVPVMDVVERLRRWAVGPGPAAAPSSQEQEEEDQKAAGALALGHDRRQAYQRRDAKDEPTTSKRESEEEEEEAAAATAPDPLITPGPRYPPCLAGRHALGRRQNDGQIQALSGEIQRLSQSLDSVTQASRSVSQASQQLSQSVQQLVQSTARFQAEAQQAQESARRAGDNARQASEAANRASQSASSAIASASSSASSALSLALASASSSANAAMAEASRNAARIQDQAASQVQAARADATLARSEANTQVSQAQGAAVSVTQAALAVVGTFIASSLLSIAVFYLILRCRNKNRGGKKVGGVKRKISAPTQFRKTESGLGAAYGSTDNLMQRNNAAGPAPMGMAAPVYNAGSYPRDTKPLVAPAATGNTNSGATTLYTVNRSSSIYDSPGAVVGNPPAAAKFSIFPKSSAATAGPGSPGFLPDTRNSNGSRPPSLQQWLKAGAVSPFGAMPRNPLGPGSSTEAAAATKTPGDDRWPLSGNSIKRPAVGRLPKPTSGGGPMMQPRTKLPFRED